MSILNTLAETPISEQIRLMFAHSRQEIIAGLVASLIYSAIAWTALAQTSVLAWLIITLGIYAARQFLSVAGSKQITHHDSAPQRWQVYFAAGAVLSGLSWAVAVTLPVIQGQWLAAGVALFLASCLALACSLIYQGIFSATLSFSIAALLPAAGGLLLANNTLGVTLSVMTLVMLALVIIASYGLLRDYTLLHKLHQRIDELQQHLDTRKTQMDKLSVTLKTHVEKRETAEVELRRTAADLGLVRSKAKALADALQRVSPYDPVTGLANIKHLNACLEKEWSRMMRDRKPLSLLALQIDFFEDYRAISGTQTTDSMLVRLGKILQASGRRAGDIAAYGEDGRYYLLLAGADSKNSTRIAEAICKHVQGLRLSNKASQTSEVLTVSIGVSTMNPNRERTVEELLKRTNDALYEATFQGGNRVVSFRAMNNIRLERWDVKSEGSFSQEGVIRKLSIWGYKSKKHVYPTGTHLPDEAVEYDRIDAVLAGHFKVTLEGEELILRAGDCLFIPRGTPRSAEVIGNQPVMCLEGYKAD